ncbi:hypothetical protein KFL_000480430 [Klebsormidium nitens]|uniref:glutathione transferase n=1 Tax=Klebsormidium nitens TaxID=105231 RepID=A0A1Y1HQY1_KLENI|nr:hypothetical protein KFL_000480430 [Klebsormidium nitens]|eukprot:GAQ80202.1 hypothetical protein KFL_000480430 [Klebsormidium nitens]
MAAQKGERQHTAADHPVAPDSSEQYEIVLYGAQTCPFSQRARIAVDSKGLKYEYRETDPYAKPEDLLAHNPRGAVPTLVHNGKSVYESLVVVEYVDEAWPGDVHGPTLHFLPKRDVHLRALARIWTTFVQDKLVRGFFDLLAAQDESEQEALKTKLLDSLREWTKAAAEIQSSPASGPFFMGEHFGIVDIAFLPFAVRFPALEHYRGFTVPDTDEFAVYHTWLKAASALPSVQSAMPSEKEVIDFYSKYAKRDATWREP